MSESAFSKLNLAAPLERAVAEMGYESMTPIQAQAIPVVMTGKDVMGAAQTGTGKTAAFTLPLLHRLLKHENTSTSPARCGRRLCLRPLHTKDSELRVFGRRATGEDQQTGVFDSMASIAPPAGRGSSSSSPTAWRRTTRRPSGQRLPT